MHDRTPTDTMKRKEQIVGIHRNDQGVGKGFIKWLHAVSDLQTGIKWVGMWKEMLACFWQSQCFCRGDVLGDVDLLVVSATS